MASFHLPDDFTTLMFSLILFIFPFFYLVVIFYGRGARRAVSTKSSTRLPTNLPVFGMTLSFLGNSYRIHEYLTDVLKASGGTLIIRGPWFLKNTVATSDPANILYILTKNFANYPKGPTFRKIFEILGDGIFNSDGELWELHRRTTAALFHNQEFQNLLPTMLWEKMDKKLVPLLQQHVDELRPVDLQDVSQKFAFDVICKMILDFDPETLSVGSPDALYENAFAKAEQALLHRHIIPGFLWKWQFKLGIGLERELSNASKCMDDFMYKCIPDVKRRCAEVAEDIGRQELTDFIRSYKEELDKSSDPDKLLRDTLINLIIAGKDTTSAALSWFFYLVATNPVAENKILQEIQANLVNHRAKEEKEDDVKIFGSTKDELSKLVYLHGALSEAMRLYPPVALQHKSPAHDDVLPSGHRIKKDARILLSIYSMARMETIWGTDCSEFKPERWINEKGGIKQIPSFKFPAFHAGPRSCLGKEMSYIEMKIIAITIIYNFHIELVEGHAVIPSDSVFCIFFLAIPINMFGKGNELRDKYVIFFLYLDFKQNISNSQIMYGEVEMVGWSGKGVR